MKNYTLVDTHCHLDFSAFDHDREQVIARARRAGVMHLVNPSCDLAGAQRVLEVAKRHEEVFAAVGVHPNQAHTYRSEDEGAFSLIASHPRVRAIGEIGLDYHRGRTDAALQRAVFERFLALAKEKDLPVIVHDRDAHEDVLALLKAHAPVRGVMHCFSGDERLLGEYLRMGFFVSFTGVLTYPNAASVRTVVAATPIEKILLETDAPFLAPQTRRGERNEPENIPYLIYELARLKELSLADCARITTHNANELFRLGVREEPRLAYAIRDSLYLNITNQCTNQCSFCTRAQSDFVKGHNLRLVREPSKEDVLAEVENPAFFAEIVFCGFGEPTMRLNLLKELARYLKEKGARRIRLITNGHGDLINKRPIAPELAGLIDQISVSLNVDTAQEYHRICQPRFDADVYDAVLAFIRACVARKIDVEVTCLDLPGVDVAACRNRAAREGARFRLRRLDVVG